MGKWIETATYWHGDLLQIERRPFTGWCVEGKEEIDGTVRVLRIVRGETERFTGTPWDFDFLRVFAIAALVHATFVVMVALTPKPPPHLVLEETIRDDDLRRGILADGHGGDGWGGTRTRIAPIAIAPAPGPSRIVIPTPPGSRVRSNAQFYGEVDPPTWLLMRSTDEVGTLAMASLLVGELPLEATIEEGVPGGVVGELIGTITSTNAGDARCATLVDHLTERVFQDETSRSFLRRQCRKSSPRALDCLERATSRDPITPAGIVAQCGDDLPPALTARLRALDAPLHR